MKIGIQGERGSACDVAATTLVGELPGNIIFVYLANAENVTAALVEGSIDMAVLASESPVGVPVPETAKALTQHREIIEVSEFSSEVRHCIMVRNQHPPVITKIASHPIPLQKHHEFLAIRFPGYEAISMIDTGVAAQKLAEGILSDDTAVIAMPGAAEIFGLKVIESNLPANDNYLTRFVLVRKVA